MKIRKFVLFAIMFAMGMMVFAQNTEYETLLAKAKEYEKKKQFIYALGTYYDAIAVDPTEGSKEAQDAYSAIFTAIMQGNPGFGEFDEFDIYDNWVLLCKEYEKYWTEYSPKAIMYSLERDSIDRATKTGNYKLKLTWDWSAKYEEISFIVLNGLKKSWREDWTGVPEDWPNHSIYMAEIKGTRNEYGSLTSVNDTYLKDGVALFQTVKDNSWYGEYKYDIVPAALVSEVALPSDPYSWSKGLGGLIDLKVKIVDQNGKTLITSPRISLMLENSQEPRYNYNNVTPKPIEDIFKGVDRDTMKIIDSGNIKIELDSAFLEYGNPPDSLVSNNAPSDRTWMKQLPELKIDNAKFTWGRDENAFLKVYYNALEKELKAYLADLMVDVEGGTFQIGDNEEINLNYALPEKTVTVSSFKMMKCETTIFLWKKVMSEYDDTLKKNLEDDNVTENMPIIYADLYDIINFCNSLSEYTGLTPCYKIENKTVYCDFNANGYRLATEVEWEYAARGGNNNSPYKYSGSDDWEEIAATDDSRHEVMLYKPNALGIYDMSGNEEEICWPAYNDDNSEEGIIVPDSLELYGSNVFIRDPLFWSREHLPVSARIPESPSSLDSKSYSFRIVQSISSE